MRLLLINPNTTPSITETGNSAATEMDAAPLARSATIRFFMIRA